MIHLEQAVIVEGKYDKIKLQTIFDAVIITTNGFGIYKDREKAALIRHYAATTGIIILTDSDTAGFRIRQHLKGTVGGNIKNVYIPEIFGKERR
ncbi:MAG: toprim domain-containing protein, partial [Oscillospiraceae bacterium]|nr:toprim domain-containing protein [Oscillospiraceae bacterium]